MTYDTHDLLTRRRRMWADEPHNKGRYRIEADEDRVVGLSFDIWHHDGIEPNYVGTYWSLAQAYAVIANHRRGGDGA